MSARFAATAFAFAIVAATVHAADSALRFVTLRDGSIIRVDLSGSPPLAWDHNAPAVAPVDLAEARFSSEPAGKRIRTIKKHLAQLASQEFHVRESASVQLFKIAPGFGDLLTEFKDASADPEIRYRLTAILSKVETLSGAESSFDFLLTRSGKRLTGDVGDWKTTVNYRGHRLLLSRENVAAFTSAAPDFVSRAPPGNPPSNGNGTFDAIREDRDDFLPDDLTRTGFETDPDGRPLRAGDDISSRFSAAGFRISTSIKGAIVSVNDFTVQGRSKGLSAATHAPLWQGTLTVDFHAPGSPSVPASVTSAGFWVASVSPGGTALEAYDEFGELVGTVKTIKSGHEFLAFRSSAPIAQIRIVPNVPIDPNYTVDDLFFTRPTPRGIRPEEGWGVVRTFGGERLLARRFTPSAENFALAELSLGIGALELGPGSVAAFAPPPAKAAKVPEPLDEPEDIHWIMLKSGSRLRATRAGFSEHRWVTLPNTPIPSEAIAAFWGKDQTPVRPPITQQTFLRGGDRAATPSPADPALWLSIESPALGESWISAPTPIPGVPPNYHTSPVVWFSYPVAPVPESHGSLVLTSGERITLSPEITSVDSITSTTITVSIARQKITIPLEKITSCQLPNR